MISTQNQIDHVVSWLRHQVNGANAEGLVLGVSGGIDSAVCAFLIKEAFPNSSFGLILPCKSISQDLVDAKSVVQASGLDYEIKDLSEVHEMLIQDLNRSIIDTSLHVSPERLRMADANLRARLRMSVIYSYANALNYLVVGTDNRAELYTGYFTKYGDGAVDILPIANLLKREVREWAKVLGVPENVINKAPSAGLWVGQTDEDELGISYDVIDDYLSGEKVSEESARIIERFHRNTQHKRETPPKPPPLDVN